ncbi:MAG: cytochrome P450 [Pseudomonadota bacterium]
MTRVSQASPTPPDSDGATKAIVAAFDLRNLPDAFLEDPYPVYRLLRETQPVHLMPDGSYFLTRHGDLDRIYRDTATFSSDKTVEFAPKFGDTPLYEHHTTSLVFNDPPLHTRVRKLIAGALTPRAIATMEPGLVALVDRLLDAMEARGEVDLIADFASAIPVEIIGNLLAVPEADRGPLRDWSLAILGALEPSLTPQQEERGNRAVTEFCAYLRTLVADRRRSPGDPDKDVLTRLIVGDGADRLDERQLLHNCIFLLNAGHETTTNLIGNALEALWRFPDEKARLVAEPDLIKPAIEEVLRFESSNQLGNRRCLAACEIGGVPLEAGTLLTLCIGAANRDPAVFAAPEVFDISRRPNRHLAFAAGPHACAGLSLARLEGQVAIGRFLARFANYTITARTRGMRARFRGFAALHATVR